METFKYGDRVTHQLHGNGKVYNVFPEAPAVQVHFDGHEYGTVVHPVSLTKATVAKFESRIVWKGGAITLSGPLDKQQMRQYMSKLNEEDMDSYTVTRIKSADERVADYMAGMEAEDEVTKNA
jgi:hypothetical protein